jgi:DNA-binding NarL/FixJ family response regulator
MTEQLTPREQELAGMLLARLTNKAMARQLDLAEATIKLHMRTLCRKMGVETRVEAAAILGMRTGMMIGSGLTCQHAGME